MCVDFRKERCETCTEDGPACAAPTVYTSPTPFETHPRGGRQGVPRAPEHRARLQLLMRTRAVEPPLLGFALIAGTRARACWFGSDRREREREKGEVVARPRRRKEGCRVWLETATGEHARARSREAEGTAGSGGPAAAPAPASGRAPRSHSLSPLKRPASNSTRRFPRSAVHLSTQQTRLIRSSANRGALLHALPSLKTEHPATKKKGGKRRRQRERGCCPPSAPPRRSSGHFSSSAPRVAASRCGIRHRDQARIDWGRTRRRAE